MGKMKHARKSYHMSALKAKKDDVSMDSSNTSSCIVDSPMNGIDEVVPQFSGMNIFKNVEIPPSVLKQQLTHDYDKRSMISSKTTSSQISKKEKRQLKRQHFLQKLEAYKVAQAKRKEAEKRKQTPVVGDMQPLHDALPMLDYFLKEIKREKQKAQPWGSRRLKQQNRETLECIEKCQQIQKQPDYLADPFGMIMKHIKLSIESNKI